MRSSCPASSGCGDAQRMKESPYVGGRTLIWLKVNQRDYRVEERGWDPRTNRSPRAATGRSAPLLRDDRQRLPDRRTPPECIQGGFIRTGGPCG
jgi:hypothetical protein